MPDDDDAKTSEETTDEASTETPDETQDDASDDARPDADSDGDGDGDGDADEGGLSEPVDQTPALRDDGHLNLGICHFGGADEPASILATRSDGTGWIGVCENHTKDAEEQGFVLESSAS